MIEITYSGVKWGIDKIEDHVRINLIDEQAGTIAHVPFSSEALAELIKLSSKHLTNDQKKELAPLFMGGLELPGRDFNPFDLDNLDSEKGPQG